jgi:hypothetical protein
VLSHKGPDFLTNTAWAEVPTSASYKWAVWNTMDPGNKDERVGAILQTWCGLRDSNGTYTCKAACAVDIHCEKAFEFATNTLCSTGPETPDCTNE